MSGPARHDGEVERGIVELRNSAGSLGGASWRRASWYVRRLPRSCHREPTPRGWAIRHPAAPVRDADAQVITS